MSTDPLAEQTTPQAVASARTLAAQPVVLVDRIAWQWYLATAGIPLVGTVIGFIAGIVFMAKSKIGPAFALWATAYLAAAVWGAIGWALVIDQALNRDDDSTNVPPLSDSGYSGPESDADSSTGADNAPTEPLPEAQGSTPRAAPSGATRACGNLAVSASSTSCEFAQNVFWQYWIASNGGEAPVSPVRAFSPMLGRWVSMSCDGYDPVVCHNGAGAEVRIPDAALTAYTQDDADRYAATHTVGGE